MRGSRPRRGGSFDRYIIHHYIKECSSSAPKIVAACCVRVLGWVRPPHSELPPRPAPPMAYVLTLRCCASSPRLAEALTAHTPRRPTSHRSTHTLSLLPQYTVQITGGRVSVSQYCLEKQQPFILGRRCFLRVLWWWRLFYDIEYDDVRRFPLRGANESPPQASHDRYLSQSKKILIGGFVPLRVASLPRGVYIDTGSAALSATQS